MALSALTVATAERASESNEKEDWVKSTGDNLPYSEQYPETRRKAKELAYYLSRRLGDISVCDGLPPRLKERASIAQSLMAYIWVTLDEEAAK